MALVTKTVHITIEDETWTEFKIHAIHQNKTIPGLLVEQVHRTLADAAFEEPKEGKR